MQLLTRFLKIETKYSQIAANRHSGIPRETNDLRLSISDLIFCLIAAIKNKKFPAHHKRTIQWIPAEIINSMAIERYIMAVSAA